MKIGWVLGWAVPESWFAKLAAEAFPHAEHVFVPATRDALTRLKAAGRFDWVVGYSLGSHLLLSAPAAATAIGRVALLAPIFAFPAEENLGGRMSRTNVKVLTRWLRHDPASALADFYARAGLCRPSDTDSPNLVAGRGEAGPESATPGTATPAVDDLRWGLDCLAKNRIEPPMPAGWRAWCGGNDPLLDACRLRALDPQVEIVSGANHHPAKLIAALKEHIAGGPALVGGASSPRDALEGDSSRGEGTPPPADPRLIASFDRAASHYYQHARVQTAMADWLAEWLPPRRDGRALELGAGPGVFTQHLRDWGRRLVATDASAAMCAQGATAAPDVIWQTMRAENPASGPWDWIFSSSMLQWVPKPANMFRAWREQLGQNGRVLAGLFVEETLPELHALLGDIGPVRWRSIEAWRAEIAAGGLRLVRDEMVRKQFEYSSAVALLRSLHGVGAAPERRLSGPRLREMIREYQRRYGSGDSVRAIWAFYRFEAMK